MNPKVTVIIPTKDRDDVLARAIDSVLSQDYDNIELLVIDDGSTDGTKQILEKYNTVPNFAYVTLEAPASGTASMGRNIGLSLANSDYVSFIDSDDEVLPHKFRIQMSRMLDDAKKMEAIPRALRDLYPYRTHSEIDVCYTAMTIINHEGARSLTGSLFDAFYGFAPHIILPNAKDDFGTNLTTGLFRKEVFHLLGGFKLMRIGEDSEYKDRMRGFGCNESFEEQPLYNYYTGSPNSLMGTFKPSITDAEKADREKRDIEYANYKREMRMCPSEEEFIAKFCVPVDTVNAKISAIHNAGMLKLDEKVPMTDTAKQLLAKALIQD